MNKQENFKVFMELSNRSKCYNNLTKPRNASIGLARFFLIILFLTLVVGRMVWLLKNESRWAMYLMN